MNTDVSPREAKKTPPDLKWLLNERAAVAGAILKLTSQCQHFDKKLANAKRRYQAAAKEHRELALPLKQELNRNQGVLKSLDSTMRLAYKNIRVDAAGVVCAWAGHYGARGALTKFVEEAVRQAFPESLSVQELMLKCIKQFHLNLPTPADRKGLQDSVRGVLRRFQDRGLMERVSASGPGYPSYWRAVNRFGAASLRKQAAQAVQAQASLAESASHEPKDPT